MRFGARTYGAFQQVGKYSPWETMILDILISEFKMQHFFILGTILESRSCFSRRVLSKTAWVGGLLVDGNRLVKLPLEVDEALALRLGHRQGRVHHDDQAHRGVAGERPVKPAVFQ